MEGYYLKLAIPLVAGYLLDLILGDPRWMPHPIRLFGNLIQYGERHLNKGESRLMKGALLAIFLTTTVFLVLWMILHYSYQLNPIVYYILASVFVFYGLANKSLLQEGREVFDKLHYEGLEAGRKRLSWIVGRDTANLNENQVRTAVFETLSENLSDGVIAPLFYYAIAGVPGMMTYKMINTLDSMIGYKSDRYILFGKFAARMDDVANFIPARITSVLMALVMFSRRSFVYIFKYGNKHASPNSGYPEAALAGILNCRFGGPNVYHGRLVEKPYIGDNPRTLHHHEFTKVAVTNHAVTVLVVVIILLAEYLR